jgi:hypothetical protein
MELTAGSRWKSAVCDTEVIVVQPAEGSHSLGCGGAEMVPHDASPPRGSPDPTLSGGTLLGKRYSDEGSGLELLCTKAGVGTLTLDGSPLEIKSAKPLHSSD